MELGNLIFGNSRGEYLIERNGWYEGELSRLFDVCEDNRDTSWRDYGIDYENDVFKTMSYYWGDCTCGFDDYQFTEEHIKCYQSKLDEEKIRAGWIKGKYWLEAPKSWGYDKEQHKEEMIMKELCKEMNIDWNDGAGCKVHCTCDYDKRYEKWLKKIGYKDEHKRECMLEQPNFLHKPTGLKIKWYKYPLRDAYSNIKLNKEMFRKIIDDCIKSINPKQ